MLRKEMKLKIKKIRNTKNVTYFFISSVSFYKLSFMILQAQIKAFWGNAALKRIDKSTQCVLQ